MAKRSLRGLKTTFDNDRLLVLEHPYSSHLWSTPEATELALRDDVYHPYFSACCYGGTRTIRAQAMKASFRMRFMMRKEFCALIPPSKPNTLGGFARHTPQGSKGLFRSEQVFRMEP